MSEGVFHIELAIFIGAVSRRWMVHEYVKQLHRCVTLILIVRATEHVPSSSSTSGAFLEAYPSYATTRKLDELRATEYPGLDGEAHTYLDFTAANLYATSQLERHHALLRGTLFGNPHSTNPTSSRATEYVARARRAV